ncbi:MAG: SDR family NAD(P)-dependent oxidoreductase [Patescibacteria group bacterium]
MTSLRESGHSPERPLEGKIVVITGGSRGIGAATALAFAREGANLVISSTQNSERSALQVVQEIEGLGQKALWVPGDIRNPATGELIIQKTVKKYGRLDVLVNNAGIIDDALFIKMTFEQWKRVIDTNLIPLFSINQKAINQMMRQKPQGGSIVFVTSVASEGNIGQANYAAAKAGIEGFAKTIALEYERFNIQSNIVAPGLVETDMTKNLSEKVVKDILDRSTLKRPVTVDEVAKAIIDSATSGKTGQRVEVW